jgi:anti-sigma factor RsiW
MQQLNDADGRPSRPNRHDPELARHLEACPACARAARAAKIIDGAFKAAASGPEEPVTPFAVLRSRIEQKTVKNQKEFSLMEKAQNKFSMRPKLYAGLGVAVAAFLFLTLVPFSYTITTGFEAVAENVLQSQMISAERLVGAMNTLGYENASVKLTRSAEGYNYRIGNLPDWTAGRQAAAVLAALTGASNVQVVPTHEKVSGSLYARATDDRVRIIEISTNGGTEEQIEQDIAAQLTAAGFISPQVDVTTSADGIMQISLSGERSTTDGNGQGEEVIEINLKGTNDMSFDVPSMEGLPPLDIETEGKTDAQIKAEAEAKLAAKGITGVAVQVETRPDGQKAIKVTREVEEIR